MRPPWSRPEHEFLARCTGCGECIEACATGVIVPWRRTPVIDFHRGECTFCGDCARACPEGLFLDPDGTPPWKVQIRLASHCLSLVGVECRICGDHCETRAIGFRLAPGGVARIRIDDALCTGCGACVAPCPEDAIRIVVNPGGGA
ncbi:MAG: ferredoxin-type protein NapF [Gammaproteobacteria bacterium]|nr:MAG: ferredoxin-type protein NapF [Gammaproteobacteria bacterium]